MNTNFTTSEFISKTLDVSYKELLTEHVTDIDWEVHAIIGIESSAVKKAVLLKYQKYGSNKLLSKPIKGNLGERLTILVKMQELNNKLSKLEK